MKKFMEGHSLSQFSLIIIQRGFSVNEMVLLEERKKPAPKQTQGKLNQHLKNIFVISTHLFRITGTLPCNNSCYYTLDILTEVSIHRQAIEYPPIFRWSYFTLTFYCTCTQSILLGYRKFSGRAVLIPPLIQAQNNG